MVTIREIKVHGRFKYLWLKYVTGVDLSVHCARCLKGAYSNKVGTKVTEGKDIPLDEAEAKAYYLCGVTMPFNWSKNFHLAFVEEEGSLLEVSENGIDIVIENARRIDIVPDYINPYDPNAHKKAYSTCRNWQFAYMFHKGKVN